MVTLAQFWTKLCLKIALGWQILNVTPSAAWTCSFLVTEIPTDELKTTKTTKKMPHIQSN